MIEVRSVFILADSVQNKTDSFVFIGIVELSPFSNLHKRSVRCILHIQNVGRMSKKVIVNSVEKIKTLISHIV